jgi:hypothetical protein
MAKLSNKPKSLPNKPSALILLALKDLEQIEASNKYNVNMSTFHSPSYRYNGKCSVCLAGAVMAKTLNVRPNQYRGPIDMGDPIKRKLYAIDHFRQGGISAGFYDMRIPVPALVVNEINIIDYSQDPDMFKTQMTKLARDLKELGY